MADRKITLLELHLDEPTFSATKGLSPSGSGPTDGGGEPDAGGDGTDTSEGGSCRRHGVTLLGVLLLLALLAAVARALMGDDEAMEELGDLDEIGDPTE